MPRDPCVSKILSDYKEKLKSESDKSGLMAEDIVDQVIDGIKLYFDKACGNILLYRFERSQYSEIKEKGGEMSDIYGAEHLLRLFGKIYCNV